MRTLPSPTRGHHAALRAISCNRLSTPACVGSIFPPVVYSQPSFIVSGRPIVYLVMKGRPKPLLDPFDSARETRAGAFAAHYLSMGARRWRVCRQHAPLHGRWDPRYRDDAVARSPRRRRWRRAPRGARSSALHVLFEDGARFLLTFRPARNPRRSTTSSTDPARPRPFPNYVTADPSMQRIGIPLSRCGNA